MTVGLRQPHRQIDGGVIGHVEKQDLRCADQQDRFDLRRLARQAALELAGQKMPQRAEPPQHRRDDGACQSAVAFGQRAEPAGFEQVVERASLAQHAADDVGRDAARWQARRGLLRRVRFGSRRFASWRHWRLSCPAFTGHDNG